MWWIKSKTKIEETQEVKNLLASLRVLKNQKDLYGKWLKLQDALLEASTYDIVKSMDINLIERKIIDIEQKLEAIMPLGWRKNNL